MKTQKISLEIIFSDMQLKELIRLSNKYLNENDTEYSKDYRKDLVNSIYSFLSENALSDEDNLAVYDIRRELEINYYVSDFAE
jgi:hypothetical protein